MSYTFHFADLEVITSKKYINQEIKSHGGGGYIINGSGRIDAPGIYSETSVQVETFLRKENGGEVQLTVNKDIALRDGHKVRLFSVWNESDKGFYVALYNKETKVVDYFPDAMILREMTNIKEKVGMLKRIIIYFLLFLLIYLPYKLISNEASLFITLIPILIAWPGVNLYNYIIIKKNNKKTTSTFISDLKYFVSQNV
jgi:hypothetical protein